MDVKDKIQKILDEDINVKLALHGGGAELTSFEDGVARIRFSGACASCMSQTDTFDEVVKALIMKSVPEVRDVMVDDAVSDELLDFARKILSGKI
ncbi:MAG: NifU family protein [Firmicutes bacterium]|nr:NifU family protein [Bacillota bacterium]